MQREGEGRGQEALEPQGGISVVAETPGVPAEEVMMSKSSRDEALFINRDLSLVAFFERVLDEARDGNNPLLERLKFIGTSPNRSWASLHGPHGGSAPANRGRMSRSR